jgi:hypothetical protein
MSDGLPRDSGNNGGIAPPRLNPLVANSSKDLGQLAIKDVDLLASVVESTKRSSHGKLGRGTIWPGLEAFGYALQTPTSLRFEAITGTCARCSLAKLHRSIR